MKKQIWIPILVVVVIVAGVLIFSSQRSATPQEKEVIKIGVISPLTGSAVSYGEPAAKAVALAAEQINNDDGILGKKVKLILEDGACDSKTTINAVNKLVNIDRIKIILGGHCSTESLTIAPVANKNKIIQLASITSSAKFTDAGDYSFRNWPTSDYYVAKLSDIAYKKGAKKIALLYEQKEFPTSAAESFKKRFEEIGGQILLEQTFHPGEKDLRSYLLKIKETPNVDSIFFASQGDDVAVVYFKTLSELGMIDNYKLFTNNVPVSQKIYDETGGLIKNVLTTNVYVNPERPKTKKLLEDYKKMYREYPQTNYFYVACSADALYLIKDAIESCGDVDTECIKRFLYNVKDWEGTAGSLTFDKSGDAITTIGLHYFNDKGEETWEEIN